VPLIARNVNIESNKDNDGRILGKSQQKLCKVSAKKKFMPGKKSNKMFVQGRRNNNNKKKPHPPHVGQNVSSSKTDRNSYYLCPITIAIIFKVM